MALGAPRRDRQLTLRLRSAARVPRKSAIVRFRPLGYVAEAMWYRVDVLLRADVDDDGLHKIAVLANTYAILDSVEASRETDGGDCRFISRVDAPSAEAALGSLLTVIAQTSGHTGLAEEGSLRRVTIEREEPILAEDGPAGA